MKYRYIMQHEYKVILNDASITNKQKKTDIDNHLLADSHFYGLFWPLIEPLCWPLIRCVHCRHMMEDDRSE